MEDDFKKRIIAEVIKLEKGRDKDDDNSDEESWGTVEEIWGSAIKVANLKNQNDFVNIVAGDFLKLDFELFSSTSLPMADLEKLRKEISDKTDYDLNQIDINLKAR